MRKFPAVFVLWFAVLGGCASLEVPKDSTYPFRASFTGSATIQGRDVRFDGALAVNSPEQGFAQVYGPGGLVAYSVGITKGEVTIHDLWGRTIRQYSIPLDQFLGLVAGEPPDMRYLWRRSLDGLTSVTYTWGTLVVDRNLLPHELQVKGDPKLNVRFVQTDNTITLLMNRGSDRLRLVLDVIRGGRWMKGPLTNTERTMELP
ncbi:MAG: hypothetical protein ACOX3E_10800 [Desulfomonilia bacterium]|nr:hypothetical protein [Pseudomonadota bacterium]HON38221.1 hypothetical protein [Deltaproteobacteria bacterium]HRS56071.1 hypothetical protein [Desulfomonilia bacterium]HPD21547.1 hypothetical protein [Deltaproteobacteria bacterium]HPX19771.1 hypothetical protein [Deltaproteobacteria bacterium]